MSGGPVGAPVTPAQLAYSGSHFSLVTGLETVPTNFPVVILDFTGFIGMIGTPALQAGVYVGQRVLTVPSATSSGTVEWVIHGGDTTTQPILSPITQAAYGSSYCECIDWVWDGTRWNLVSVFNPYQGGVDGNRVFGSLTDINEFALNSTNQQTLFSASTIDLTGISRLDFLLSGNVNLDYNGIIPFSSGFYTIPEGKFLIVSNIFNSFDTVDDSIVTLYDAYAAGGTNLYLATERVILRKHDWIFFMFHDTGQEGAGFYEIARSRQNSILDLLDPSPTAGIIRGADTVRVYLTTGPCDFSAVLPSLDPGFEGQVVTFINRSVSSFNLIFEDDTPSGGSTIKLVGAGTINITPGSSLTLRFDENSNQWWEVSRALF